MSKTKTFEFTYRCEVKRFATVEAKNEKEARKLIDAGKFDDEHDMDVTNIDDICFIDSDEE
jgi:hypothetical protein